MYVYIYTKCYICNTNICIYIYQPQGRLGSPVGSRLESKIAALGGSLGAATTTSTIKRRCAAACSVFVWVVCSAVVCVCVWPVDLLTRGSCAQADVGLPTSLHSGLHSVGRWGEALVHNWVKSSPLTPLTITPLSPVAPANRQAWASRQVFTAVFTVWGGGARPWCTIGFRVNP